MASQPTSPVAQMTPDGECWVITDGAAGNQRQASALAAAWAMPTRQLVLRPRAPWSWLAPRLTLGGARALDQSQRALLAPPWPQVAIGCGRSAALFTRLLRRWSDGACYCVQILDPHMSPSHWDAVIAPQHDRLAGAHVLTTLGSLNPVDDAWLAQARRDQPALGNLPRPRVGVLLGGPRKHMTLSDDDARRLASELRASQQASGGSVLVVASRRTLPATVEVLREALRDGPGLVWASAADGENPYAAVLGWADELVVTPDSVNMLSEACAVGCPVRSFVTAPLPGRISRFHQALRAAGYLQDNTGPAAASRQAPLRETATVAALLAQRINARAPLMKSCAAS